MTYHNCTIKYIQILAYVVSERKIRPAFFFILLAEVRKRTGKRVTAKTVTLAVLWFLGIVILLILTDSSREKLFDLFYLASCFCPCLFTQYMVLLIEKTYYILFWRVGSAVYSR